MIQFYHSLIVFYLSLVSRSDGSNNEFICSNCPGIIVDTDCGGDDAMAISVLLKAEAANHTSSWGQVIGFTTVTGNTGAANATRNVRELLKVLGRTELPVYQGMEDGLSTYTSPLWFFGFDGLGDFLPPAVIKPITPSDINPGFYLASMVHKYPNQITILCLGPLTNVAMALHFNDNFFNEVRHIVILGGDYKGGGNVNPGVESNMFGDPDGAAFFFSKIPRSAAEKIILFPIEPIIDIQYPLTFRTEVLGNHKSALMTFLNNAERLTFAKYGNVWPCYDPTAASYLLDSEIVSNLASGWVEVITQGPRGAMFAQLTDHTCNVNIATAIDKNRLSHILQTYLTSNESVDLDLCKIFEKPSFWAKLFSGSYDHQIINTIANKCF